MAEVFDNVEQEFATQANASTVPDEVAETLAAAVRTLAASHTDHGTFEASIHVGTAPDGKHGRGHDRIVYSDDPLAMSKEFGHEVYSHGKPTGRTAKGVHAFRNALNAMPEVE